MTISLGSRVHWTDVLICKKQKDMLMSETLSPASGTRKDAWMICPGGLRSARPRCSLPGDLLKQKEGKSTLGFPPGGARGWCGVGSVVHGFRGSVEAEVGERLETVEKNPGPRSGGRGKAAENRRARRESRYCRRRERGVGRGEAGVF